MPDITALGELLVDFTEAGVSPQGMKLFEQNPGGAVVNCLGAAAKQGLSAAFIGKVGNDMHGRFLKKAIEDAGISSDGLVFDDAVPTTLAFVGLDSEGEREFSFIRNPGADTRLTPKEVDQQLVRNTKIFHIGSLSLTSDPARAATWQALITAKAHGAVVTYDPNYRAPLWESDAHACDQIRSVLPIVDIIKVSEEEISYVAGIEEIDTAIQVLRNEGVSLIIITLGKKGAIVATQTESRMVEAYPVNAVDTTGAGDAFFGGFLSAFLKSGKSIGEITIDDMETFAKNGCATAAICVTRRGGLPAMPTLEEISNFLDKQ